MYILPLRLRCLCDALIACARRIATKFIDPIALEAYVACRLVPLDKKPGVRPIGIGEVVRRIIGKAILKVVGPAVESAVGRLQLCGGQAGGVEAAIHAIKSTYDDDETEGVLFADAANAFNCINRAVCLRNVQRLCPELAPALINTYRSPAQLYVGGEVIMSSEGTTPGDPLAITLYALGTVPLIREASTAGTIQSWYADDATSAGFLRRIRTWLSILIDRGSKYGYNINPSKSVLLVKPRFLELARELFANTGVDIRTDGYRHLGAGLGTDQFCSEYVSQKVASWCNEIHVLAKYAASQPQAAYAVFTHALRHKWSFLARTMPAISDLLVPLEQAIRLIFLPALTGRQAPGESERMMLSLPCRNGGLGLIIPTGLSSQYSASVSITKPLVERLLKQEESTEDVFAAIKAAKLDVRVTTRHDQAVALSSFRDQLSLDDQRILDLAAEKGASSLLTCRPSRRFQFTMPKSGFRDALCLRYGWTPPRLPTHCVCGKQFDTTHALSCSVGGFPGMRHNEIRDLTANLLREVAHDVCVEPALEPLSGEMFPLRSTNIEDHARLDVAARGLYGSRFERTMFDVWVFNPFVPSNRNLTLPSVYRKHEQEKRRKYQRRVLEVEHSSVVPIVFSTTGGQGKASSALFARIASKLSDKRNEPFSVTMAFVRTKLSFSLVRAMVASLRGYRRSSVPLPVHSAVLAAAECSL